MHPAVRILAKRALGRFDETLKKLGIGVTSHRRLQLLEGSRRTGDVIQLLLKLPEPHAAHLLKCLHNSKSASGEDLFVLSELGFKTNGFFVEFGAANGIFLSNTWVLEKEFGWRGIIAEPARAWHKDLRKNRNCHIETDCVWSESNATLTFRETVNGGLSTIESFSSLDSHTLMRRGGKKYSVRTISLNDMLEKYDAPREVDYLSIDTEGSEFDILKDLNFDKYQFGVITCEHNLAPQRERIFELLTQNGYVRKFEGISDVDDWYVKAKGECPEPS